MSTLILSIVNYHQYHGKQKNDHPHFCAMHMVVGWRWGMDGKKLWGWDRNGDDLQYHVTL